MNHNASLVDGADQGIPCNVCRLVNFQRLAVCPELDNLAPIACAGVQGFLKRTVFDFVDKKHRRS
jgi:hypothetical protein